MEESNTETNQGKCYENSLIYINFKEKSDMRMEAPEQPLNIVTSQRDSTINGVSGIIYFIQRRAMMMNLCPQ